MKTYLFQSIRLTLVFVLLLTVMYPALIWSISKFSPDQGNGFKTGKYYTNLGQKFDKDEYFNSRPSAVDYNAASSCGSNKGNTNPEYLKVVSDRIDTFLVHNPAIKRSQIPAELVTASGSGLDPDLTVDAANVQVPRIAKIRGISETSLYKLITLATERPCWGILGPEKVNVLKLNLELKKIHE